MRKLSQILRGHFFLGTELKMIMIGIFKIKIDSLSEKSCSCLNHSIYCYKHFSRFSIANYCFLNNQTDSADFWFLSLFLSYSLFRMFDELVLLAKGGLTVYHGRIKKLEEYFAGLGITVPERENPPDYFIDILEGIIKPDTTTGVTCKQLPVRWMLHNGYPVPPDMLESEEMLPAFGQTGSEKPARRTDPVNWEPSFVGDLWNDLKTTLGLKQDILLHNFFRSRDLSNRITPGVFSQYKYFLGR